MNHKDLLLIISKTSGAQKDLTSDFKKILDKKKASYVVKKCSTPPEIEKYLRSLKTEYKVVAVYGGDGSIISAIKVLKDTSSKLLVLPGGTANTIAAELQLPNDPVEVLKMYTQKRYVHDYFDIASINNQPLVLDMHTGWWSEAIKDTPRTLKKRFGPVAYGMSALKSMPAATAKKYSFTIDSKKITVRGYTLLVANRGKQGFLGINLFPKEHKNGILQVAVIKNISPVRIFIWLIGRYTGKNIGGVVKTYRGHVVSIEDAPKKFVTDDAKTNYRLPIKITGAAHIVTVLTQPPDSSVSIVKKMRLLLSVTAIRIKERTRNLIAGEPSLAYSQITPKLYLGGTYRSHAYRLFKGWGVTGIVNMRNSVPKPAEEGFEILHLKTRDWTSPSVENFEKGVEFINKNIKAGGKVYVHCRQGEGRGPSMAAAYLISQGLTLDEALRVIKKSRPVAKPNPLQVKRLAEWQEYINKKTASLNTAQERGRR